VTEECDHAIWLEDGRLRAYGDAGSVIGEYEEASRAEAIARTPSPRPGERAGALVLRENRVGTQELTIEGVELLGGDVPAPEIATGGALTVAVSLRAHGPGVLDPIVGVAIHRRADGVVCYDSTTAADGIRIGRVEGEVTVRIVFEQLDLLPGEHVLDVGIYSTDWATVYDFHWHAYPLRVMGSSGDAGVFRPPHRWEVER
jgi:lipopolysaccharide transport system ATP-binding protein